MKLNNIAHSIVFFSYLLISYIHIKIEILFICIYYSNKYTIISTNAIIKMTTDWLVRIGDGDNFIMSSKYKIWGVQSKTADNKYFIKHVVPGDRLWFVKNKSQGKVIAVATYRSHNTRDLGPLISTTMTNEELGWTNDGPDWTSDIEIHYTDLYNLNNCELLTHIKSAKTIRKYNEKCKVELPVEYNYIVKYSKVISEL